MGKGKRNYCNMHKLISIVIFLFLANPLQGQEKKDFQYFNTLTYNQYLAKDWKNLIETGREAIHLGYDSYYMRMRMGIALYSKGKYMRSEKQFRQALNFDSGNPVPMEYLHYTMLFINREKEAISSYPIKKEDKTKFFKNIYIESGYKASDDKALTRDIYYGLMSLRHGFSKRVTYFHAFQYLIRNFVEDISMNPGNGTQEDIFQTKQTEYYGALEVLAGKGFDITPAFHIQGVSANGYHWNNFALSLGLSQHIGIINIYANASYSKIDEKYQYQGSLGLTIYPLSNLNLYIDNFFTIQNESDNNHASIKQKIGGRVLKKTWLEGWYRYGDMRYFNEQNGFILFNSPNTMHYRIGGGIVQGMGKHTLFLNIIKEYKEDYETGIDFSHLDLIIGINFNF